MLFFRQFASTVHLKAKSYGSVFYKVFVCFFYDRRWDEQGVRLVVSNTPIYNSCSAYTQSSKASSPVILR